MGGIDQHAKGGGRLYGQSRNDGCETVGSNRLNMSDARA